MNIKDSEKAQKIWQKVFGDFARNFWQRNSPIVPMIPERPRVLYIPPPKPIERIREALKEIKLSDADVMSLIAVMVGNRKDIKELKSERNGESTVITIINFPEGKEAAKS